MWSYHDHSVYGILYGECFASFGHVLHNIHNTIIETSKTVPILFAWNSDNFFDNIRMLIDRTMHMLTANCNEA